MKACRWVFISMHRNEFGMQRLCQVLGVHRSAYYKWLAGTEARAGRAADEAQVSTHDFQDKQLGKTVPYGIYDLAANSGWVNVGTDDDTATFAVESIRRCWTTAGRGVRV